MLGDLAELAWLVGLGEDAAAAAVRLLLPVHALAPEWNSVKEYFYNVFLVWLVLVKII